MSHTHILFLNFSDESGSVKDKSYGPKLDVKELEMLLEAYFAQINGILQKLSSVCISFELFYSTHLILEN